MSAPQPAGPQPSAPTTCYAGQSCQAGQTCQQPAPCPPPKTGLSAGDIAAIILGILFVLSIFAIIFLALRHPKCPTV